MLIRRATPDDAVVLAKIHIDSWRSAYRGLVPNSYLDSLDYDQRAQRFREWLAGNAGETYLAEMDGKVFGFLTLGETRDTDVDRKTMGEIWGIYLAPEHWRKGIGSLLCRHGEKMLTIRGCCMATLWVFAANTQARRFYEAMGFKADGASKIISSGTPLEAVRYRKDIGTPQTKPGATI